MSPLGLLISRGSDTINGDTAGLFVVRGMSESRKISLTMSDTDWANNIHLQPCIDLMSLEKLEKNNILFLCDFTFYQLYKCIVFQVLLDVIQSVSWKYREKLPIIIFVVRFKFFYLIMFPESS